MFRDHEDDNFIALCDIRPPLNRFREYSLERTTTLWGAPAIRIVWGRRGGAKRTKVEDFADEPARERRWRELVQRRVRHGYVLDERPRELLSAVQPEVRPLPQVHHGRRLHPGTLAEPAVDRVYRSRARHGAAWRRV